MSCCLHALTGRCYVAHSYLKIQHPAQHGRNDQPDKSKKVETYEKSPSATHSNTFFFSSGGTLESCGDIYDVRQSQLWRIWWYKFGRVRNYRFKIQHSIIVLEHSSVVLCQSLVVGMSYFRNCLGPDMRLNFNLRLKILFWASLAVNY